MVVKMVARVVAGGEESGEGGRRATGEWDVTTCSLLRLSARATFCQDDILPGRHSAKVGMEVDAEVGEDSGGSGEGRATCRRVMTACGWDDSLP